MIKKAINFIFEKVINIPLLNFAGDSFPILTGNIINKLRKRKDWIFITAFSPDGIHFASGGFDSNILLWNIFKEKPIDNLSGHEDWIIALTFSHNGKYLLSGSRDSNIILWSIQDRKPVYKFEGHQNRISSLAFSQDNTLIASGGYDSTIKIWDIDSEKPISTIDTSPLWPTSICFAQKNKKLITGFNDGTINIYSLYDYTLISTLKIFQNWVDSIKCSKDQNLFYSSNVDGFIKIIDIKTNKLIFSRKIPFRPSLFPYNEKSINFVDALCVYMMLYERSPESFLRNLRNFDNGIESFDYKIFMQNYKDFAFDFSKKTDAIACTERSNKIFILDFFGKNQIKIDTPNSWIKTLSVSEDDSLLTAGGYDGEIKIFSFKTGYLIGSIVDHASWVNSLEFSTDNKLIAAGLEDGTILITKIKEMEIVEKFNLNSSIFKVNFFNNNKFILASSIYGELFKIDLSTKNVEIIQKLKNSWFSNFLALNDETFIATSENGYIYLIKGANIIKSNKIHDSEIIMLELLDNNTLITGSLDSFLKQINIDDLSIISEKRFDGIPLAYNKKTDKLFVSHFRCISVYKKTDDLYEQNNFDLDKPKIEFQFDFNSKQFNISKDCKNLFILKKSNEIEKISLNNFNVLFQLSSPIPITSFFNNSNSSKLVVGYNNSEIRLYDTENNKIIKKLKGYDGSISTVSLSADESFMITGFEDGTLEMWLFNEEKNLWCIENNSEPISELNFSYNNIFFISKGKYSLNVDLWSTVEGTKLGTFSNKNSCLKNFEFSPNSESVLYLNDENQLSIWFIKEGKEIVIPEQNSELSITYFSYFPDSSKVVVTYTDGSLRIFSLDGNLIKEETNKSNLVTYITFKDNDSFFTSHLDGTIRFHSLESFENKELIHAHHSSIDFLLFNSEANLLASYSTIENIIKIWSL